MLTSREKILDYLLSGMLHLSKKDYSFFNNLKYIIGNKKPITTNQNKLFDKLLLKYQRQFRKNNIEVQNLLTAQWNNPVVESNHEFLIAKIYFENDFICIKAPFNNNFISSLRKEQLNQYVWHKDDKTYKAPASTFSLKLAITLVSKHYNVVQYCHKTKSLLQFVQGYQSCIWQPTLVRQNKNYYIAAINSTLYELVKNIDLNNDAKTLYKLTSLGIKIDSDIVKDDNLLRFVSAYNTSIDTDNLKHLAEWLEILGIDFVLLSRDLVHHKKLYNDVTKILEGKINYGSKLDPNSSNLVKLGLNSSTSHVIKLGVNCRTIYIRNNNPIEVA